MQAWGLTDPGCVRVQNQDAYQIHHFEEDSLLCAVCDGMGGAIRQRGQPLAWMSSAGGQPPARPSMTRRSRWTRCAGGYGWPTSPSMSSPGSEDSAAWARRSWRPCGGSAL